MLPILILLTLAYSFRIDSNCDDISKHINTFENILVHDNSTMQLAQQFIEECAPLVDPYAIIVVCNSNKIPMLADLSTELMPMFIKKTSKKPNFYANANCSYISSHEPLSFLTPFTESKPHYSPYVRLYINATLNGSIYDNFAEMGQLGILVFKQYFYTSIAPSVKPFFEIINNGKVTAYKLEGLAKGDIIAIMRPYYTMQAQAQYASINESPEDYMKLITSIVAFLWMMFISLFFCKYPF